MFNLIIIEIYEFTHSMNHFINHHKIANRSIVFKIAKSISHYYYI